MKFAFVAAERAHLPVARLCRAVGVSRSGFYAWCLRQRRRTRPRRARRDAHLARQVVAIHRDSRRAYGSPRVDRELRRRGVRVGRKRVARLMRQHGLVGRPPRRFVRTTDRRHGLPIAPHVVARAFTAAAPDRLWVGDITHVPTRAGWLYLAVLLDVFSRRVVGWASGADLSRGLALAALEQALHTRRPGPALVHHSDRGGQYASEEYRARLQSHGIRRSMSRAGDCYDNAMAESFFSTLKCELVHGADFATRAEAAVAIDGYIASFDNCRRLHSALGYLSPIEFELRARPKAA